MEVSTVYYINCGFVWFIVLLIIAGYFYIWRKTGAGGIFWPIFAISWAFWGVSHSLVIGGVSVSEWYITLVDIIAYVLLVAALFSLMVQIAKSR